MESAWQNEDENEGGGGYFSSEDEMETWEREQIRKAIGHRKVTALKEEVTAIRRHYHGPDADQDRLVDEDMDIEIVEQPSSGPTTAASVEAKLRRPRRYLNMAQLLEKLEMSVISRHEEIKTKEYQLEQYAKNIEENNESISKMTESNLLLERSFQLYQEMKFYIDTVLNCLNEKILIINEIETEIFDLWKARADDLSRRRAEEENRSRFERYSTKDAWNSDEEEKAQPDSYVEAMNRLIERAGAIFEDTATEYCDFGTLIRRLIDWFQTNPRSFRDAYVAECIPKLVGPFVRIELFLWNPLNSNCAKLSSFNWYRSILGLGFNNEGIDVDDPAISGLIPDIVEKVVLPKLTKIVNELWDPLSISQTQRLTELIDQFVSTYPSINRDSKFFKKLLAAMQQKAQTSLQLKREIPGHLTSLVTEIQQKPVEKPPASQGESYDDIQALFAQSRSVMK